MHDSEVTDDTIRRALSSPLLTHEREEPAGLRQAHHSLEESLLPSQSLSVGHVRMGRPVHEFGSLISNVRGIPCRDSENEQIRILLERQKELILAATIPNTQVKRKVSLEEQKAPKGDRFHRGRQIAYLIYEYFWVTGANDSLENYAHLFTIVLQNDDIEEFDSKWDGILLSLTKIPHDDILEGLYKLRIRESEKLKTVLESYNMEISSEESWTTLSQIEDNGEKKYRAESTN